jgi:hypothetical protein
MVRLTLIARQRDGLPLAEGLDNDKDPDLVSYKQQAKVCRLLPRGQTGFDLFRSLVSLRMHPVKCRLISLLGLCGKRSLLLACRRCSRSCPPNVEQVNNEYQPKLGPIRSTSSIKGAYAS